MRDFFRRLERSFEELLSYTLPAGAQLAFSFVVAFVLTHAVLLMAGVSIIYLGS